MPPGKLYSFCLCFFLLLLNTGFAQQPRLILPSGHSGQINVVTISKDAKLYATTGYDGKIKIWEAATGKLLNTLITSNDWITDIDFMPDNKSLLFISYDSTSIFDFENNTGRRLGNQEFDHHLVFSPDGKWFATDGDENLCIWDTKTLQIKHVIKEEGDLLGFGVWFSENSKMLAAEGKIWSVDDGNLLQTYTGSFRTFLKNDHQILTSDTLSYIWDINTGKQLMTLDYLHLNENFRLHPDGKKILVYTSYSDSMARLRDIYTGKLVQAFSFHKNGLVEASYAPNGKTFVLADENGICSVWDTKTGKFLYSFDAAPYDIDQWVILDYINNSSQILSVVQEEANRINRWNVSSGARDTSFELNTEGLTSICLSNNEKLLLTTSEDGILRMIETSNGKTSSAKVYDNWATSADISPNDSLIAISGLNKEVYVGNFGTGEVTMIPALKTVSSPKVKFSSDGKYLLNTATFSFQLIRVGDSIPLIIVDSINIITAKKINFSPDADYFIANVNKKIKIWSTSTQQLVRVIDIETEFPENIEMSHDSKYILCVDPFKKNLKIWETATGKLVKNFEDVIGAFFNKNKNNVTIIYNNRIVEITSISSNTIVRSIQLNERLSGPFYLTHDEKLLISEGNQISIWDFNSGKLLGKFDGEEIAFGKSDKFLYVRNKDVVEVYNLDNFTLAFRHYSINEDDYLIEDKYGRFDGTEAARKMLYFVCGNEVIELDQAKDQLWVPNLAERIIKGDSINTKKLRELNLCGLTPLVEEVGNSAGEYHFKIMPRTGGLGETVVYVNGIEAKRYKPQQLVKKDGTNELKFKKEELKKFFIPGKENSVTVKAYTSDNAISSRGLKITEDKTKDVTTPPNLYAVMVGISDYKGDELDLKFAAKDATDISAAVSNAAKKMLNTDGKEHVFMYNLTTEKEHYQLPEKNSIQKVLEEIGKKATANDILLIFFAGHGVMEGDKKQFYFLTADASRSSAISAVADVGISTAELTEWMKPQNIKAQKRILIFDACNSGQAIKDFVKMGNKDQGYLAARNDDKAQQIKAIDKLNEKSGLFILSASASNQSAYEMGRYSQGLLTYSLLKAIKQQPDILEEGKYLNLSRWFNAAEKTVSELSKENGARQEPQIVTTTNFNIGLVDEEVMAKIVLPQEKPLFAASNFQNADENITDDNLDLSKTINMQLNETSARGADSKIIYVTTTNSPDAYLLIGRYDVKGEELTVKVNVKQGKEIKFRFEVKGRINNIKELAEMVVQQATEWIIKNK